MSFKITAPKLHKSDGVQLLRADDGEIGLSTDANATRHFFVFGKAPTSTKFGIKFTVRIFYFSFIVGLL